MALHEIKKEIEQLQKNMAENEKRLRELVSKIRALEGESDTELRRLERGKDSGRGPARRKPS